MFESFYKVKFNITDEEYYFRFHKDAVDFLVQSFYDDNDYDEDHWITYDIANDGIEDYGYIEELHFEK